MLCCMYAALVPQAPDVHASTHQRLAPSENEQVIERPEVFQKRHFKHNKMIRGFVGNGLFTADDDEEVGHSGGRV